MTNTTFVSRNVYPVGRWHNGLVRPEDFTVPRRRKGGLITAESVEGALVGDEQRNDGITAFHVTPASLLHLPPPCILCEIIVIPSLLKAYRHETTYP